jgi:hypothetical protein
MSKYFERYYGASRKSAEATAIVTT